VTRNGAGRGSGRSPLDKPDKPEQTDGWSIFSYLIGGMILYGLIGWLVGRATHLPWLFGVGMVVGLVLATALIIYRVTRS
jgi:F0F1-type ATP synthase assembly protein I